MNHSYIISTYHVIIIPDINKKIITDFYFNRANIVNTHLTKIQ